MKAQSVIPLIELWEQYCSNKADPTLEQFAQWLLQYSKRKKKNASAPSEEIPEQIDLNGKAALLISRIHRVIQLKSKPLLKDVGLIGDHEVDMLIHVYLMNNPNKKELSQRMLIENSTGVETSKRLVKKGLIEEKTDEQDKRATRLTITAKGKEKLHEVYRATEHMNKSFLDCFEDKEMKTLVALLERLEEYQLSTL